MIPGLVVLAVGALIYGAFFHRWGDPPLAPPAVEKMPAHPWGGFQLGERVIVLGLPFTGKSRLAAKLTKEAARVVYFDPMDDYAEYAGALRVSVDDFLEAPEKYLARPRFRVAVIPSDSPEADLEDVVAVVRAAGSLVFVMDEVGDYRQGNETVLNRIARNGRHDGIVSVFVSQVAVDIPLTVRRLATRVYSYLQVDPDDIQALERKFGPEFLEEAKQTWKSGGLATWTLPSFRPKEAPPPPIRSRPS